MVTGWLWGPTLYDKTTEVSFANLSPSEPLGSPLCGQALRKGHGGDCFSGRPGGLSFSGLARSVLGKEIWVIEVEAATKFWTHVTFNLIWMEKWWCFKMIWPYFWWENMMKRDETCGVHLMSERLGFTNKNRNWVTTMLRLPQQNSWSLQGHDCYWANQTWILHRSHRLQLDESINFLLLWIGISTLVGGDWNMDFIFPCVGNDRPNWLIFLKGV